MIYIQKRGERWWVWMGFASDDDCAPDATDKFFDNNEAARDYAFKWYKNESVVEYGVIELDPMPDCPNCGENDWQKCMHGVFCGYCQGLKPRKVLS